MQDKKEELLTHAQSLLQALESDDFSRVESELQNLSRVRDHEMFQELGRLTRDLHQAILALGFDPRLKELAEHDIPDAKSRLQYVISMTEEAAHRTMSAVEELIPLQEPLLKQAEHYLEDWERLYRREMAPQEFARFARDMKDFLEHVKSTGTASRSNLTEILMAQEFQDISSQIIRRVIQLVQQVEEQMVTLVQAFARHQSIGESRMAGENKLEGPRIPEQARPDVVSSQDEVDDLLSSLGF